MEFSDYFLDKFTTELILNSAPSYIIEEAKKRREIINRVKRAIEQEMRKNETMGSALKSSNPISNHQINQVFLPVSSNSPRELHEQQTEFEMINNYENYEGNLETPREYPEEGLYLGDLLGMVEDYYISTIECPGPGRHVIAKSGMHSRVTPIIMDMEEIEAIIESFSRETNIPRIGGVFKAMINNLIITAIESDFSGPRFIITKIHPYHSEFL